MMNLRNLTILLGSTTTVLAATIISPSLPGMADAFSDVPNVDLLVPLALTMPALFIAVGALFAGYLLDKIGRRPVLIVSLILYGVFGTVGFFLDSLIGILISRAILGLAVAGIMSGFTTLILDYFEGDELNKFLGWQGAFIGLGGMVFLLAAGILADVGWKFPFLVHLFALLILPGVFISIVEPEKLPNASESRAVDAGKLPWRQVAPIYMIALVGMIIFFVFPVQIPFYLAENPEITGSQVGLALSLNTLSSVIAALLYQRIKARFSFQFIVGLIFIFFALNHFIVSLSPSYSIVVTGLLVGGLGIGLFPPNNSGWLATVTQPQIRGKAVGGMTSLTFLGQFLSPIVTQPIIERVGLADTFTLLAIVTLLIGLLFFTVFRMKRPFYSEPLPIEQARP